MKHGLIALVVLVLLGFVASPAVAQADTTSFEGKPAPDFSLATLDGGNIKLSELKGKVVVIDLWATWCPPCRASMPHLQAVHANKEFKEQGLKVLAINATTGSETKEKAEKYCRENKFDFTVPLDTEGKVMADYKVRGIPTTLVIGRDGVVKNVFIGYGGAESDKKLDDAIRAALKEGNKQVSLK